MVTRKLAKYLASLSYGDLPATTVEMAKRLLLDGLGCLIAGTLTTPGRIAAATVRQLGGFPQATILIDNMKVSVRDAAFANGMCLYSVGLNDLHKPSGTHPGACVIPVLLAVGEWLNCTGDAFLAAMAAGYEAMGRIGRAISPGHRERGFHPTGTCGAFGATAAAGRLFGLDGDQMACAFGIAGSQAAGLYEFHHDGALTMIFHAARAAQNGVEAALLTQEGLTGPATVIEGSKGFALATANTFDTDVITRDLGKRFELDATSFRPYFGCSSTIAASGAMAEIMKRLGPIQAEEVENIMVHCHPV
ncbi:MAG: MmgE/PrpD family protein, partial [Candidatus Hodarchaeales archaeon]